MFSVIMTEIRHIHEKCNFTNDNHDIHYNKKDYNRRDIYIKNSIINDEYTKVIRVLININNIKILFTTCFCHLSSSTVTTILKLTNFVKYNIEIHVSDNIIKILKTTFLLVQISIY